MEFGNLKIGNLIIYKENVERLSGMITGYNEQESGVKKQTEGDINIGKEMSASTRIGPNRDNQEDAVLIMRRSENPKYKLLCVADGVGGNDNGEYASHTAVEEMKNWFNSLEIEDFQQEENVIFKLSRALNKIHFTIQGRAMKSKSEEAAATTLVCAIVCENNTYIVNIGDSRAYMLRNGKLKQITRDDSVANEYYERGYIKKKDDMRFVKGGNYVMNVLGGPQVSSVAPKITTCNNNEYDAILLFSDGVTDCLSDDQIFAVTKWTSKKKLAKKLVEKAISNTSKRAKREDDQLEFYEEIPGGKDNTTAAVLFNDDKKGKDKDARWYDWNKGWEWCCKEIQCFIQIWRAKQ